MINGQLVIIGEMEIDGKKLTGAFIECTKKELKKGIDLFAEKVMIVANPIDLLKNKKHGLIE